MISYVRSWMIVAAPDIASRGPQKSFIECLELTWQTSPNRKETPVTVIVAVKKAATTDQPRICAK